jgi:hypothetical protein
MSRNDLQNRNPPVQVFLWVPPPSPFFFLIPPRSALAWGMSSTCSSHTGRWRWGRSSVTPSPYASVHALCRSALRARIMRAASVTGRVRREGQPLPPSKASWVRSIPRVPVVCIDVAWHRWRRDERRTFRPRRVTPTSTRPAIQIASRIRRACPRGRTVRVDAVPGYSHTPPMHTSETTSTSHRIPCRHAELARMSQQRAAVGVCAAEAAASPPAPEESLQICHWPTWCLAGNP